MWSFLWVSRFSPRQQTDSITPLSGEPSRWHFSFRFSRFSSGFYSFLWFSRVFSGFLGFLWFSRQWQLSCRFARFPPIFYVDFFWFSRFSLRQQADSIPPPLFYSVFCFLEFLLVFEFSSGFLASGNVVVGFLCRVSPGFLGFLRGSRLTVSPPWAEHLPGDSSLRRGNLILWLRAHPRHLDPMPHAQTR